MGNTDRGSYLLAHHSERKVVLRHSFVYWAVPIISLFPFSYACPSVKARNVCLLRDRGYCRCSRMNCSSVRIINNNNNVRYHTHTRPDQNAIQQRQLNGQQSSTAKRCRQQHARVRQEARVAPRLVETTQARPDWYTAVLQCE